MTTISELSIKEIGEKITIAGRLKLKPLCVYGSGSIPDGAIPITSIDRCLAKAIFMAALSKNSPPLYFGRNTLGGCCPGGIGWTGYGKLAPIISYFISYGKKEYRNGEAEYLKASPEAVEKTREAIGTITPPGTYTIVRPCDGVGEDPGVRSVICFADAERIRNLCSLIHFRSVDPFNPVKAAWGPVCATLLTYPAALAEKAPGDSAYIGPMEPTGNAWFPGDHMALGIPLKVAIGICEDLDHTFVMKRPHVAYPEAREVLDVSALDDKIGKG